MTQASMTEAQQRRDARHVIGSFVAPGTQAGVMEGFMVVDLSRTGMSLLRVGAKGSGMRDSAGELRQRGLDHRFSWLAVPLPERGETLCALAEVVHRRGYGPLEWLGVRFEHMSEVDSKILDEYLSERNELSFGSAEIPNWQY